MQFTNTCPICQSKVRITRYHCDSCDTTIEGSFLLPVDPFSRLSEEQRHFMLTFVRAEGRLNRMEEILGMSYPTLKNRLNELITALGFQAELYSKKPSATDRQAILDDLEAGRIDSDQALRYLQGDEPFINENLTGE
jgi:hypothetical protein